MPFTISQTHVCLIVNLVLLNLTLSLTVHFHAVHGYGATHMHITHVPCFSSILPLPCSCIMSLISIMPALDDISRSDTNMYIIGIASSDQVQRQQQRNEPVRENTHLVLDILASRLRS